MDVMVREWQEWDAYGKQNYKIKNKKLKYQKIIKKCSNPLVSNFVKKKKKKKKKKKVLPESH